MNRCSKCGKRVWFFQTNKYFYPIGWGHWSCRKLDVKEVADDE